MILNSIKINHISKNGIHLKILRLDEIHPYISGNKWFKLKYNLEEAKKQNQTTLLTFGGAYSNHIEATAAAGKMEGFKTIGIIRGEEKNPLNPTLTFAQKEGMILHYIDRENYRKKNDIDIENHLKNLFGNFYLIPEGGTNFNAIKGTEEVLAHTSENFDVVCCAVGTGGTLAGIINSCPTDKKVLGFAVLKGDFLANDIKKYLKEKNAEWQIQNNYHFGGYAKFNLELIEFINTFKKNYNIPLDPIYTGKMMFGIFDMIEKKSFPENSKILVIHSGGLQGIDGFNERFNNLIE